MMTFENRQAAERAYIRAQIEKPRLREIGYGQYEVTSQAGDRKYNLQYRKAGGKLVADCNCPALGSVNQYKPLLAYGRAKLANLLFTYKLARRLSGSVITVNAINPGGADTALSRSKAIGTWTWQQGQSSGERGLRVLVLVLEEPVLKLASTWIGVNQKRQLKSNSSGKTSNNKERTNPSQKSFIYPGYPSPKLA